MRVKKGKRMMSLVLAFLMVIGMMPADWTALSVRAADANVEVFTFNAASENAITSAATKGTIAEGKYGTSGYYTLIGKGTRGNSTSVMSLELGLPTAGSFSDGGRFQFTVTGSADVKISATSTGGSNTSELAVYNSAHEKMGEGTYNVVGTSPATEVKITGLPADTYTIQVPVDYDGVNHKRGFRILSVETTQVSSGERAPRADWSGVAAPVIGNITSENGTVTVPFTGVVGYDGADTVEVTMSDATGVVDTKSYALDGQGGSVAFKPSASGTYTFVATAKRAESEDKVSESASTDFVLPLAAPTFSSATSKGNGKVNLIWNATKEATGYKVSYSTDGNTYSEPQLVTGTEYEVSGLTVGTRYTFKLTAVRNDEETSAATIEATATEEEQMVWSFSAFGSGVDTNAKNNGYEGNANDGKVSVWELNSKGKMVPKSTDGLAFYYAAVPADKNFTFSADVHIDQWTLTNGQEGFGLMAADRVGTNGDSSIFWNNSYMATATKVEYFADKEGKVTDDSTADKITMKIGVGSQEKKNVTNDLLPLLLANDSTAVNKIFSTKMTALDTSCGVKGVGTYNLIGNGKTATAPEVPGTVENPITDLKLEIQKNNTGYFVSYTTPEGEKITKKYYDTEALEQLDKDNVYVGIFASRTCKVTATNINLKLVDPKDDADAEERPITYVTPSYQVYSATVANKAAYDLKYTANADGKVVITAADGTTVADQTVEAGKKYTFATTLTEGTNKFTVNMTPDKTFKPSEFEELSSYDASTFGFEVEYRTLTDGDIYVTPDATSAGNGTKENPVDVYTATSFAKAGQTIYLAGGTYNLTSTITIQPGVDGEEGKMITMTAAKDATERPVFDFGKNCEGFVVAGDYWHIEGLDVTNSANSKDGIRLGGSNCILDNLHTYHNGNTGLQISRYMVTDGKADWPANNLILNCTSYGNADAGYEDADGFAAKLTIGEGNVFDGCIAHNNADDGWDLFAKAETGPIGSVTLKNCVAYANGYLEDGTDAGNGNGFKMGGSSITGYHTLINSVAFDNKSKGIDSNSCPDIQVKNSTSFNNYASNVALYTNDAANTDFSATGILSYRTQFTNVNETFKLRGTQDETKVYQATDYYWNYDGTTAHNSAAEIKPSYFESIDTGMDYATRTYAKAPVTRNADNTVNMNGLLAISEEGKQALGENVGAYVNAVIEEPDEPVQPEEPKALDTVWKESEIGTHTDKGSYSYDKATKTVTVNGAGTKFDKDGGVDDFYYAYVTAKENITLTAKMKVTGSGQAGIMLRNTADEVSSATGAVYADMSNKEVRAGNHGENAGGGAGQINSAVTPASESIYIKIEVVNGGFKYYAATKPDFSDAVVNASKVTGLAAKTVGFFATAGTTAEFSDVKVTSKYDVDGTKVSKIIFDSEMGEFLPEFSSSKDYSGVYAAGTSMSTVVDGNILKVTHKRDADNKGNIREDKSVDFWLFPATNKNLTISADVSLISVDSGTDKQGLAMGQFVAVPGSPIYHDAIHYQKKALFQHSFSTGVKVGNTGDPKTATLTNLTEQSPQSYTISYTKNGATGTASVTSAAGEKLIDNGVIDYANVVAELGAGKTVRYGFAFSGIVTDISNVTVKDEDGNIIYDMNDYYIAVGVAPEIANATATVADDRESIAVNWDVTAEGSGNVKYNVYVSKDGGEFVKAGDTKVNSFTYKAMNGDGTYAFKVVPVGGDTLGTPVETTAVSYQTPLNRTVITAAGTSKEVALTWTAVEGATSYDVYKKLGSDGTATVAKTTADTAWTDTDVVEEEPYYYYVIAKNDNNTSNPSETVQVLTSDGHTGAYVYENAATKVTVDEKSNDTIFDTTASVTLHTDEDVTVKASLNGAVTETKAITANEKATFAFNDLKQGRNDVEFLFTDKDNNTTRKIFNFVSNPEIDIVVDSAFTGNDGDVTDGYPTYKTVQAAVSAVPADNAEAKVIFIKNGEYEERVEVTAPYVSLLGEDAEKTHLFYAVCVANGNANSMWNRNAMYVEYTADGFTAENLTIENSYAYSNGNDQQADALCIVADKTLCVNVRLIGYQDTLLTDSRIKDATGNYEVTRQYFDKCYITGNVDFIYGAGTSVFNDCDIVARYTSYKNDGVFTAGRTYASTPYGYTFIGCRFLAEDGVKDGAYRMARPWGADDSTTFINCYLGRAIQPVGYGDMSGNSYKKARFAEFGSYGPGYVLNADRPLLSQAQAKAYTAENIFGDYDYATVKAAMYGATVTPVDPEPVVDPLTVAAKGSTSKVVAGNKVTVTGTANGGDGAYTYRYLLYNPTTKAWTQLQPFGTKNTYTWTATGTGARHLYVEVKDGNGTVARSKAFGVTVTTRPTLTTKVSASKVATGGKVTITATASQGSGSYTYRYIMYNPATKAWTQLQPFGTKNTYTWTATGTGARHLYAEVKDSNGTVTRSNAYGVTIVSKPAVTVKASTSKVVAGNTVTVTATASQGSGNYTYRYVMYNPTTKAWSELQGYSTKNTYVWTATGTGARHIYVDVKDSLGTVTRSAAFGVTVVTRPTLTAKYSASKVATGGKVTITATASQGSGKYTYRYIMYNPETKVWTQLQPFGAKNTYTWTVTGTGARHLYVEVKDSNGTVTRSSVYGVTIVSKPTVTAKVSTSKVAAGKTVTVTATAGKGSGNYTYRYVMYNPATKTWTQLQGYSSKNTYTWKATGEGARHIYVDVKDSLGTVTRSTAVGVTVTK